MIQLNYRDSRPIYEQIQEGLKHLIITGAVATDEKMPSVRELSSQLAINPNTIAKAYKELEQEGYIYTVTGKGSFASDKKEIGTGRNAQLLNEFDKIVKELLFLQEDKEQLKERIEQLSKGGVSHDSSN